MKNSKQRSMPLLVESICAEDGRFHALELHKERMKRSCRELWGREAPGLTEALEKMEPTGPGIWKVRVLYRHDVEGIESAPYTPAPFKSAALIDGAGISYRHKTVDKTRLNEAASRAHSLGADAALLVKNGLICDFTYANAVFHDGLHWYTPAQPLLQGTRRQGLLNAGLIRTADIKPADLGDFKTFGPINALLDLGQLFLNMEYMINLGSFC